MITKFGPKTMHALSMEFGLEHVHCTFETNRIESNGNKMCCCTHKHRWIRFAITSEISNNNVIICTEAEIAIVAERDFLKCLFDNFKS